MMTIILVACVSKKADVPLPGRDLYRSTWFRYARRYAELVTTQPGDRCFILSARYGLVDPDEVIYPYNQTLNEMGKKERRQWAIEVERELYRKLSGAGKARIIFLAGKRYRAHLAQWLALAGYDVLSPLKGLGIGQQVAWLKWEVERSEANRADQPN